MFNIYKKRVIFFLFGIILVINTILLSLVFFAYSSIVRKDYSEKLTSVASQTAANANLILSFYEEEVEVFINKYNVEENLDAFRFDAPNFIRKDSTNFEDLLVFKGNNCVYASDAETADFYGEILVGIISDIGDKNWFISEEQNKIISTRGTLIYVRTLFERNTNKQTGWVVAAVSQSQFTRLLNLNYGSENDVGRAFIPHSVGICVDDKILFLGQNSRIIQKSDNIPVGANEKCVTNSIEGREIFTIHNTEISDYKIFIVFILLVLLLVAMTFFSYTILKFMVNEICLRIDSLNSKMELYSPSEEERNL